MRLQSLAHFSHHTGQTATDVPLLGTSSAGRKLLKRHCLFQAVAHVGEKCGITPWLLALALASQMGASQPVVPTAMPELIATRQALFAIPFRIERSSDPVWQPVEAQLYVSTDRGAHWRQYTKAPTTQKQFTFRAGGDGEYWFAIRTADRSGQVRPLTINAPGLRVLVDSKQPATNRGTVPFSSNENRDSPRNENRDSLQHRSDKPAADAGPALTRETNAMPVAGKPAIGRKYSPSELSNAASTVPGLPPGERLRMVNSRTFDLEYEVDSVGPSGVGRVELWGTSDGGQTWRRFTAVSDKHSPLRANVTEEGVYGFRVVVANGAGFGGKPPVAGDQPDLWIGVDLTKPTARIVSAQQGVESEAGQLIISWQADDKMLAARPVSLMFSQSRGGPWSPIAAGLENTGRYAWPIDNRTPPKLFLRLEVRDEAGNVGVHETTEPVIIDQSRPTVRVRSVRPVSQSGGPAMR